MVGERKKTTVDGMHGLCGVLVFVTRCGSMEYSGCRS